MTGSFCKILLKFKSCKIFHSDCKGMCTCSWKWTLEEKVKSQTESLTYKLNTEGNDFTQAIFYIANSIQQNPDQS